MFGKLYHNYNCYYLCLDSSVKLGTIRIVKQIADLMGHDPDTNLKIYARFQTKDLERASDFAEIA